MENKIFSLLGLIKKSGNLISGDDTTLRELKKGNVSLVIIAEDASDNTKKLFKDKSNFRDVDNVEFATKNQLGWSIGTTPRAVIGIKDKNFAKKLKELLGGEAFVKDKSI